MVLDRVEQDEEKVVEKVERIKKEEEKRKMSKIYFSSLIVSFEPISGSRSEYSDNN